MKRKLLFAMAMLLAIAGVQKAKAYSTTDLTNAGWTLVTGALTNVNSNYYLFVDGANTNLAMARSGALTDSRPVYQLLVDPTYSVAEVWTLEASNDKFIMKSYADNYYYSNGSAGWNSYMGATSDGNSQMTFSLQNGKYHISGTGGAIGVWSNYNLSGGGIGYAGTAGNKGVGGSDDKGFYIYQIARANFTPVTKASVSYADAGWEEVTAATEWGRSGYYYVFLDCSEGGFETNMVMTATENGLLQYQWSDMADNKQVWTTETAGSGYAFKSVEYGTYSNYTAPWAANMSASIPGSVFIPSLIDGKWQIRNTSDNNNWLGRWGDSDNGKNGKNDPFAGENLASNKSAGNGKRLFRVFSMASLAGIAEELPASGNMVANKWYYFDIDIADNYRATATTLANIVYTTEGTMYVTNASNVNTKFSSANNSLVATRYYVKSSSANNLVVAPASYSYSIDAAVASLPSGSVIKQGTTISVSFAAHTNDPTATVTNNFTTVTFGGASVTVNKTNNGFSFAVPSTVTADTEYVLSIPAGKFGYTDKATTNAAATFTFHTLFDGVYYLSSTDTNYEGQYISRGGHWATQAITNDFGLATYISIDNEGVTTLQFFDNDMYLGDDGFCYTDCTDNRVRNFRVKKVANGYTFTNTNNSRYLAIYDGQVIADAAVEGNNLQGTTNVWKLESASQYAATRYAINSNKQVAAAATAAGLSNITTGAQLEAAFSLSVNVEIPTVERASALNQYGENSDAGNPNTYFEKSVTGLADGLYKLTFKAMQRGSSYARVDNAEGARGLVYAYANDATTQLVSAMEQGATTPYASNYASTRTGLNYPNDDNSVFTAFDNGLYENTIYVYVTGGTLKFGIKNPSRLAGNFDTYVVYGDFTLTHYMNSMDLKADIGAIVENTNSITLSPMGAATSATLASGTKVKLYKSDVLVSEITPTVSGANLIVALPTLEAGATYKLTLDENKVTFNGGTKNSAFEITFRTPVIASGVYYLYNKVTNSFLGLKDNNNAIFVTENGDAITWTNTSEGATIKFNNRNTFLNGRWWSEVNGESGLTWEPVAYSEGELTGYQIIMTKPWDDWKYLYISEETGGNYLRVASNGLIGDNFHNWAQAVWEFWTEDEYNLYAVVQYLIGKRQSRPADASGDGQITLSDITKLVNKINNK